MHGQAAFHQQDTHRASRRLVLLDLRQHPLMCRQTYMQVRAQDVNHDRHASEAAPSQRDGLPSAPPLPALGASALHYDSHTASRHVQYPSLQACRSDGERADSQRSRRPAEPEHERVSQSMNTGGSSEGVCDAQRSTSARGQSPERPAGALAWAMQATACATGAALAALSARLPWHQHKHSSQSEAEQDDQQTRQAPSQKMRQLRRCCHLNLDRRYCHVLHAEHNEEDALLSTCSR